MAFPTKICSICSEEFILRPDKPGFATHCPECTAERAEEEEAQRQAAEAHADSGLNEARRKAMRDLLYRRDS